MSKTASSLTFGSLFSGFGGIDLGLERAGMECRWQCEIDPYAQRVLGKHWPNVIRYADAREINYTEVPRVDVLAAGFVCKDISSAGAKGGIGAGLISGVTWNETTRAIGDLRPRYVLVENVADLLVRNGGRDFATVLGALADLGYDAEWDCLPAASVGSPQRRWRAFLVAYRDRGGFQGCEESYGGAEENPSVWPASWEYSNGLAMAQHAATQAPAIVSRMDANVPDRVGRLAGTGNAVVPALAELVGRWIIEHARKSAASAPTA